MEQQEHLLRRFYTSALAIALIGIILLWMQCHPSSAQGHIPNNVIKYPGYTSYWNPSTLIPDSVIYIVKPHTKVAKRLPDFHVTGGRDNLTKDYRHSGYDIGHCAAADDMDGNATDEYNSFDFVNVMPQRPNCNRITWLALENYTRSLRVPVKVKVSYIGSSGSLNPDGVTIPDKCVKELWYNGHYEKYVMPNSDTVNKHQFTYYKIRL